MCEWHQPLLSGHGLSTKVPPVTPFLKATHQSEPLHDLKINYLG